ncbi:FKBP-type peptidyl-prolyl cis-trans isomerase [Methylomonas paludis]|uniref:Peptidyl-prolyl cis-trans isomerase n=1 Tax=Methylomonas paludis TaxID=1173101 RepID=A0A975MLF1_9GAMM|nr:FKBP-type peptidyl-prolyl cis-trans isomerase N-terminal domain-containing protein [Methylomonas paludis]QWF69549.1 FKBP-type peptidyl-prolyl cis-trans isomerase [Methylomonas paludis]
MKNKISIILAVSLAGQAAANSGKPHNDTQKYSYALAVDLMKTLNQDDMALDNQAFLQALRDMQSGRGSQLDVKETRKALDYFVLQRVAHRKAQAAAALVDGRSFLLNNLFKPGVTELPSGLQYLVLQSGEQGRRLQNGEGVSLRYRVSDINGREILNGSPDGASRKLVVNEHLLSCWKQALPLMQKGDKWRLFSPPDLAYGEAGSPDGLIKPNQTLIYEMEVMDFVPEAEALAEMDKPDVRKLAE